MKVVFQDADLGLFDNDFFGDMRFHTSKNS